MKSFSELKKNQALRKCLQKFNMLIFILSIISLFTLLSVVFSIVILMKQSESNSNISTLIAKIIAIEEDMEDYKKDIKLNAYNINELQKTTNNLYERIYALKK